MLAGAVKLKFDDRWVMSLILIAIGISHFAFLVWVLMRNWE
jgi:hypothetical protein